MEQVDVFAVLNMLTEHSVDAFIYKKYNQLES